jgi:FtsZ-binding cell division protein ZapB
MELSPIDRIEAFCRDKGIGSLSELGRLIGASAGTFSIIKKRGRPPGTQVMQMLTEKYPDLNANWVLSGRGSMYVNDQRLIPATQLPTPPVAAEPTVGYGCLSPDFVALLTSEVTDLRAENKALDQELRHARREFREDFIAQARQYNSVKINQESFIASQQELIKRLYTKIDEYELRLGIRQPTQQEREQMQLQGGSEPRMEVKPFGARYRETSYEDPQAAASDEPRGRVIEMYQSGEVSLCEAA